MFEVVLVDLGEVRVARAGAVGTDHGPAAILRGWVARGGRSQPAEQTPQGNKGGTHGALAVPQLQVGCTAELGHGETVGAGREARPGAAEARGGAGAERRIG